MPIKMFYKNRKNEIEVYAFFENGKALIFDGEKAHKQNGNGWERVNISNLIPLDQVLIDKWCSKSEKNKIKSKLRLVDATWETTDGKLFNHTDLENAIVWQKNLMENEEKGEN